MFEAEIARVIEREGGSTYTNRPSDRGGPTKWGVTLATLTRVRKRPCTADDVRTLTATEAMRIYREEFVLRPGFHLVADPLLREHLIDFGVVSGPERAIRWLQRVMGTPVTGRLDEEMVAALHQQPVRLVNNGLVAARLYMIDAITDSHANQKPNEEGWENRALLFLDPLVRVLEPARQT